MFGIETLTQTTRAVVLVGVILIQALLLYVGYGAVEQLVAPRLALLIAGE